ncbi:hypothetical protein [Leifsonia sp. Leaf264]|uniref:hypothetical protein n=1 Tax=Leifsonia sp. Leaf264 TaxID=1736314 RepID=UPI0006F60337|nr:hypothetical protein [Leifsonia sp. Leaf264]KQO98834.1 hypothetical protein ASF30_12285 [Leifsonia sp. Leaf264]
MTIINSDRREAGVNALRGGPLNLSFLGLLDTPAAKDASISATCLPDVRHPTINTYARGRCDFSEDAFSVTANSAVLIDGASGLGDVNESGWSSDSQWFAHNTAIGTTSHLQSAPTVAQAFARSLADLHSVSPSALIDGTHPVEFQPAAAGTACRVWRGNVQVHVLADVVAVVRHDGGVDVITDTVLPQIEETMFVAARQIADEQGITFREAVNHIGHLKVRKRTLINDEDHGYPVLSLDGSGVQNGLSASYPAGTVQEVLLLTDGYAAAVTCAGVYDTYSELLTAINKDGLAAVADKIIDAYTADPDFEKHPRFKAIDDMTAVHLRFA